MSAVSKCKICNGSLGHVLSVREMMYGTRDEFAYQQCDDCGCLQISEIPDNIAKYYPENYYSFDGSQKRKRWLRDFVRKYRSLYAINHQGWLGAFLCALKAPASIFQVYGRVGLTTENSILDVGGGGGGHVQTLHTLGFTRAIAIDPFIASDLTIAGHLVAKKADVFEMDGTFDLITFHHSFEHMERQREVLEKARNMLTENGKILIRIPTVNSEAFDKYGANWSDLDAPRHFYLHSHKSIAVLVESVGLRVDDLWCDSNSFQFWASEQYAADIPLYDSRSYSQNPNESLFKAEQMAEFEARSKSVNDNMRGDSICVLCSPSKIPQGSVTAREV